MCYTTTAQFTRCSHRVSITTFCPRSTHPQPTIYHHPGYHIQPCSHEANVFVQQDGLCEACSRANSRNAGGGGVGFGFDRRRTDEPSRKNYQASGATRMAAAAAVAARPPPHHLYAAQGRAAPPARPAGPVYPVPTAVQEGRCPLSEAFERAMRIGGGGEGGGRGAGPRRVLAGAPGGGEGFDIAGGMRAGRRRGKYGPFRPPHLPAGAGSPGPGVPRGRGGGVPPWPGGYGENAGRRTARRTAGRKQVRFAPRAEVVLFRGDWPTRTVRDLSRENRARR